MNPQPTDQEDTYAVSVGALSASSRASKLTQTTLYLIISFVIVAIGSAALVVPKIIANVANQVLEGFSKAEFLQFRELLSRALANAQAMDLVAPNQDEA